MPLGWVAAGGVATLSARAVEGEAAFGAGIRVDGASPSPERRVASTEGLGAWDRMTARLGGGT